MGGIPVIECVTACRVAMAVYIYGDQVPFCAGVVSEVGISELCGEKARIRHKAVDHQDGWQAWVWSGGERAVGERDAASEVSCLRRWGRHGSKCKVGLVADDD